MLMNIEKLKSPKTWIGALVAAILAAALYLMQSTTGTAPEPPDMVEDFAETLSTDIFGETEPEEIPEDGSGVSSEAPDEGSGK